MKLASQLKNLLISGTKFGVITNQPVLLDKYVVANSAYVCGGCTVNKQITCLYILFYIKLIGIDVRAK